MYKKRKSDLLAEIEELRAKVDELEETLRAIRSGEVDALLVSSAQGPQVFTLEGAESPYRIIVESINEGAATLSPEGTILYANRMLASMLRLPLERVIGASFSSFVEETHNTELSLLWEEGLKGSAKKEMTLIQSDGQRLPVYLSVHSLPIDDTEGLSMVVTDISERKHAEEELKRAYDELEEKVRERTQHLRVSEQRLVLAQKAGRVGVFDVDLLKGTTVWTPEMEALFGLQPGGFEGTYDDWTRRIHPDDLPGIKAQFERWKRERREQVEFEYRIIRADGQVRWISASAQFHYLPDGTPARIIGTNVDITERKLAEKALKRSEEKYKELVESANSIILRVDPQGRILFFNEFAQKFFGYREDEVIGKPIVGTLIPSEESTGRDLSQMTADILKSPEVYTVNENENMKKNGERVWVSWTNRAIYDRDGKFAGILAIGQDVTERKRMEETIRHQAHHDLLTGLANRALFIDTLAYAISQAHRDHKKAAVLFLDLDRFKSINDTLGHTAGDELLKQVAGRLRTCVRETDTIARIGGDEFTVLMSNFTHVEDVSRIAKKIMRIFSDPFTLADQKLYIGTSIGISLYPDDGQDVETLLKHADIAMYHAKEQGRNNYQFYSPTLNVRTLERMILEHALRETLERGELELFYQPQFKLTTGEIDCIEALIRWNHPDLGLLNPMQFIPLAEEIGFVVSIDEWVLRTACEQARAWQDAGMPAVCVTVNLSSRQFRHPNLVPMISQILNETGLDPKWLELEVTETIAMEDIDHTIPNVRRLTALGVKFSIDDFGTGYSSLSYLKKLPLEKLKIDKSFIRDITIDPDDQAIVHAIISMAHSMSLKVVAEGVETEEQLAVLRAAGCDEVQGYLGTHPLPTEEFEKFMKDIGTLKV